MDNAPTGEITAAATPRASAWLWRPWYAKLWWISAALYWGGKLASYWSEVLATIYSTAVAGLLNVFFFPPAIAMVLATGLVRAWMDYKGVEWGPPPADHLFPRRSVGGWRDPNSDPLDPRSGQLWIGAPENEAKLVNRHWP